MEASKNLRKTSTVFAIIVWGFWLSYSSVAMAAKDDRSVSLYLSQWTKVCIDKRELDLRGCMTGIEGRIASGQPVIAAMIADRDGKPLLRFRFPLGVQLVHGTRMIVDNNTPVQAPYSGCTSYGCLSDYELTPELLAMLKRGAKLVAQAINANGAPVSLSLPLAGLDAASSGAARNPADITRNQDEIRDKRPPLVYLADPRTLLVPARGVLGSANLNSLIYAPWTKFCLKGQGGKGNPVCFTGKDGRIRSGQPVIAAVVVEPEGEPKKILRVTLPVGMQLMPGTRLVVDDKPPLQSHYVICFANGCMSDYEATAELIADLKQGQNLVVQAIDNDGAPLTLQLPLQESAGAGFAAAYAGPPTDPKLFEENQRRLQADVEKRAKPSSAGPVTVQAAPSIDKLPAAPVAEPLGRRVALVIGNSSYRNAPMLPNPSRDASSISAALRGVGFQSVVLLQDLTREKMIDALRAFATEAASADWAVVYYAGHGMEVGGINYLIPTDAALKTDRDVSLEAVPLDQILNVVERAKGLRLIMLDACRDNPFASQMKRTMSLASRSVVRGLANVEPDAGTLVVYAAKHGETASDGDAEHSPFAAAFLNNLRTPNLEIRRLFDYVRDDVMDATGRQQQPFTYGSLSGRLEFYFVATR